MVFHYQSVQYREHLGSLYCTTRTTNLEDCTTASTVEVVNNDGRQDYLWFQSQDGTFHDKWHWLSLDTIVVNKETTATTQRHLLKISLRQDKNNNNNKENQFVTFHFSSRTDLESAKIYLKQYRNEARLAAVDDDDTTILEMSNKKTKDNSTGGASIGNTSGTTSSVTWVDESRPGHSLTSLATATAGDPSPANTASTVSTSQSLTPLVSTSSSSYAAGHITAKSQSQQARHFFPNHASTPVIVQEDEEEFEDETTTSYNNHDEICTLKDKVVNIKQQQQYTNQYQYPNKCDNLKHTNDLSRPHGMKKAGNFDASSSSLTAQEESDLQKLINEALEQRLQQLGMDKDNINNNTHQRQQSSRSCCDQCLSNLYAYLHNPIMTIISSIRSVSLVERFSLPTALCMALLVLACKIAFVVLFTLFMTTAQCTPTRTMIPAEASSLSSKPLLYSSIYNPSHNQYLCSAYSSPNSTGSYWEGCTLEGLTCQDYNQHPQCQDYQPACGGGALLPVAETEAGASSTSNPSVESANNGGSEIPCAGLVSVTYITCPHVGIVLGSSLAYVTYLELILVALLLCLAWIGKPCQKRQTHLPNVLEEDAQRRRDGRKSPHPQQRSKEPC